MQEQRDAKATPRTTLAQQRATIPPARGALTGRPRQQPWALAVPCDNDLHAAPPWDTGAYVASRPSTAMDATERIATRHSRMSLLYDLSANVVRRLYDARIDTPPVLDAAHYFPDADKFAAAWPALRAEAQAIARRLHAVPRFHEIMPAQMPISANDGKDWRVFVLKVYGTNVEKNLAACPVLAQLIAASPDVLSATLSFLAPRKH